MWVCNYLHQPGALLFCNSCGCCAQVRAVGLLKKCRGHEHSQILLLTKFIQQRLRPPNKAHLGKPRRLPGLDALPFPSAESVHEQGGRARPSSEPLPQGPRMASQPIWESGEDMAEEAFRYQDGDPDYMSGFRGLDEEDE